ncbi:hypothetical protein ACHQM5_018423 [Ranunculus cassubicifolius]
MSAPPNHNENSNNGRMKENVAKTAGFIVFSGIAFSLLKTLNPYKHQHTINSSETRTHTNVLPLQKSTPEYILQKPLEPIQISPLDSTPLSSRTVQIVKGDTLWALSKKHGVSVDAIKEANGLTGNTIYAGKKLVIP